jgi:putative transposase
MSQIYRFAQMSRQNFHARLNRQHEFEELCGQLILLIREVRRNHPRMSARQIYYKLQPVGIGRDRFEAFAHEQGFRLDKVKNYRKTTCSAGVSRFPNLVSGLELTDVNQVWVSDITYYELGNRFYYLTFIMDLYSRLILGAHASRDLRTIHTTIPALKQALRLRQGQDLQGLIVHSDGGGQYYCKDFLDITRLHGIRNSMAEMAYENPNAERINGTIKNDYLIPYGPQDERSLAECWPRLSGTTITIGRMHHCAKAPPITLTEWRWRQKEKRPNPLLVLPPFKISRLRNLSRA